MGYGLDEFIRDIAKAVCAAQDDPHAIPPLVKPHLERLISDICESDFASEASRTEQREHALFDSPDGSFTVAAMTFPPGHTTPVHDHNTWGLVGVWRGVEHEDRFEPSDPSAPAGLRLSQSTVNTPGRVTLLVPSNDIHRIANRSNDPAYSIHVYGAPIPGGQARTYDLVSGAITGCDDDPLAAAAAWGSSVSLATLLGEPTLSDREAVELLRKRILSGSTSPS